MRLRQFGRFSLVKMRRLQGPAAIISQIVAGGVDRPRHDKRSEARPSERHAFIGIAQRQPNGKSNLVLLEGMRALSTGTPGSRDALEIGRE